MTESLPSDLGQCDEQVPLLGVTREFDFGQFIELFDETKSEANPDIPVLARIVMQPTSQLAAGSRLANSLASGVSQELLGSAASTGILTPSSSATALSDPPTQPEVHLFDLAEQGPGAKLASTSIIVEGEPSPFFESGVVMVGDAAYRVPMDDGIIDSMSMGLSYNAFGVPVNGDGPRLPLNIALASHPIALSRSDVAKVLAGGLIDIGRPGAKPVLNNAAIRSLLDGKAVLTHAVDADGIKRPVSLLPAPPEQGPSDMRFKAFDLPSLFASPHVLAKGGGTLPIDLSDSDAVAQLVYGGSAQFKVGYSAPGNAAIDNRPTVTIDLVTDEASGDFTDYTAKLPQVFQTYGGKVPIKPVNMDWDEIIDHGKKIAEPPLFVDPVIPIKRWVDIDIHPPRGWPPIGMGGTGGGTGGTGGTGGGTTTPPGKSMTDLVQPRLPSGTGLPVAVFVPWKQTWTLKGFSRGNLLNSIALAPQEEVTMQVMSWERRSRTLEQSSETNVSQETDTSQTTRDTEDVFREMLAKRDFSWQLNGSLDASYSPGVASITVHADGSVNDSTSIQQTARNSTQSVRESTIKASSRVSSRRVTRVTQSIESGREERVTRMIRNPNQCHTLTLDFFETLAHYEIKLEFQRDRLRLVVLLPNPMQWPEFTSELIRRNETALFNGLLDTALSDGFAACRLVAAYDEAVRLVATQKHESAKVDDVHSQRDKPPASNAPDPAAPQKAELERVTSQMLAAAKTIVQDANIDTALASIANHQAVTEEARRRGQYWLFVNFVAAKFPSLLSVLTGLTSGAAAAPDMTEVAQRLLSVLPRPDSPTNLGTLNQMTDADKETAGLASKLKEENPGGERKYMKSDVDWAWWTGRSREEGLYTANDGGIAGLADRLQKAYTAWEAKKAQGDAMKDQETVKSELLASQGEASTDDKLSTAFPLEDLARAYERMKVLQDHLKDHREFYNYVLFQALPPSEQALQIVNASQGRLKVGLFEPRVVAMSGTYLVVPLTPLAGSESLRNFVKELGDRLAADFAGTAAMPDTTVLPTPGVSISSRLGACSGCEEFIETARTYELKRLSALADQEQREADRRQLRLDAHDYGEFEERRPDLRLALDTSPGAVMSRTIDMKTP
ncbi:MAG: hypothetical protein HY020_18320 [Burkholderiales bacterium]|nr:hypothetical protein [Burkholderiales bacterium]